MTIQDYAQRNVGQMSLLAAKIDEFKAMMQVGADTTRSRDDAHTILDAYLDGVGEFVAAAMRGEFD